VSVLREPHDFEPAGGRPSGDPGLRHRVLRDAPHRIGSGAFACPACDLPLLPSGPVAVSATVHCPFCGAIGPARSFLRLDVIDTPHNEVYVRARLPA
jgi:hypothetical protein